MRVLVADDDLELLDIMTYALRREGFNVISASDGAQALRRWQSDQPSVVVLDAQMPKLSGFEVCRRIRDESSVPVIMLTALQNEEHVVQGFQAGADDYVTKPFSHRLLAMRIRAVYRRSTGQKDAPEATREVCVGELTMNLESHEVRISGREIRLTPTEFKLLSILVTNIGHVVPSYRMVEYAWGYDEADETLLKTHISHVRKKLQLPNGGIGNITVLPRVGYRLNRADDEQ